VNRREFIALIADAAAACPLSARAQQALPVIGYLASFGHNDRPKLAEGFRRGLTEAGYADGRNVVVEYRFAGSRPDSLAAAAADLVGRRVSVIVAVGGDDAILAAKAATSTIPIVFTYGGDPVQRGFVASLNRPGGNVTGISFFSVALTAKGLGLLHEIVPKAVVVALLVNSANPQSARSLEGAREAAATLGLHLLVFNASVPNEIDAAFSGLKRQGAEALVVGGDPFFSSHRQQIIALAASTNIPVMYFTREFVPDGGLISYGNDIPDAYRLAALYCARILKGGKPADLPVVQSDKFELVINMKTANTLGLTIPPGIIAIADEVIE
jgi:putative ABC transport system substrate-binding protein